MELDSVFVSMDTSNRNLHYLFLMIFFGNMIEEYLSSQMKKAHYELIDGGMRFYAEIEGIQGVWAVGRTLEECREELLSTLEEWIIFRLQKNLPIPEFKMPPIQKMDLVHA